MFDKTVKNRPINIKLTISKPQEFADFKKPIFFESESSPENNPKEI